MLECVTVGDLHFDKLKKLFPDTHNQLVINELNKPMQYAVENGISYVFFLGDISDSVFLSGESERAFVSFLKTWSSKLEIYIILGNHDFGEEGIHSLMWTEFLIDNRLLTNVHLITKPLVIELEEVPVHFMPYPAKRCKKNHLNLTHMDIPGFNHDSGRLIEGDDEFQTGKYFVVNGHLHTPQESKRNICCGTLYQCSFGETNEKRFLHLKLQMLLNRMSR